MRHTERRGHHLWSLSKNGEGKLEVSRNREEPEEFGGVEAYLGLEGALLVEDGTFASEIPKSIVSRFNKAAHTEEPPRVYSWQELRQAFGSENVDQVRRAIGMGMKARLAGRYYNVPLVMAWDLVEQLDAAPRAAVKQTLDALRKGRPVRSTLGRKVARIYNEYVKTGMPKIAVDSSAEEYYKSYFGPYGEELVREIKRRVRADLASKWLEKHGVDEAARKYWEGYFADGYGAALVSDIPAKLSPAK